MARHGLTLRQWLVRDLAKTGGAAERFKSFRHPAALFALLLGCLLLVVLAILLGGNPVFFAIGLSAAAVLIGSVAATRATSRDRGSRFKR